MNALSTSHAIQRKSFKPYCPTTPVKKLTDEEREELKALKPKPYLVFSHGLGTDSCTIMEMFYEHPEIRKRFVADHKRVIVIFSNLGCEYDATYCQIDRQKELCHLLGWEWVELTPEMGFHPRYNHSLEVAPSIQEWWYDSKAIGMLGVKKRCTDRWKIQAIWNFMSARCEQDLGIRVNDYEIKKQGDKMKMGNIKRGLYEYVQACGEKFELIIGFTMGEEKRIQGSTNKASNPRWVNENVERVFPLFDLDMGRKECNNWYQERGRRAPRPSNCKFCFYQSDPELVWLYLYDRGSWDEWVALEKRKMKNDGQNGVKGKTTLPEYIEKIIKNKPTKGRGKNKVFLSDKTFEEMSREELEELVQYHGGCVANAM